MRREVESQLCSVIAFTVGAFLIIVIFGGLRLGQRTSIIGGVVEARQLSWAVAAPLCHGSPRLQATWSEPGVGVGVSVVWAWAEVLFFCFVPRFWRLHQRLFDSE